MSFEVTPIMKKERRAEKLSIDESNLRENEGMWTI